MRMFEMTFEVAGDRRGAPAAGEVDEAALDEELDVIVDLFLGARHGFPP